MFTVAITDYTFRDLSPEERVLLPAGCSIAARKTITEAELPELVRDADGVITQFAPVTANVIQAMRRAKAIVRYGVGYDNVDIQAAAAKGIPVCNVPDYCVDEVADHALALMLALTRQIPQTTNRVRQGEWRFAPDIERVFTLKMLKVGILGFGRIGRAVATRVRAFGSTVIAYDPVSPREQIEAAGVRAVTMEQLFSESDLISLHCPSTPETRHLVCEKTIAQMKRGAILINVARGNIVHPEDLMQALRSGQIAAAGLDVTDPEPIPSDSPLLKMDNVLITNHVAAYSASALERLQRLAAERILKAFKGELLPNVVNGVRSTRT